MDFFEDYQDVQQTPVEPVILSNVQFNEPPSQEQLERREKLRIIEEDRLKQIREREVSEKALKEEKRVKAQQFLNTWKAEQASQFIAKKEANRRNQEILQEAKQQHNDYVCVEYIQEKCMGQDCKQYLTQGWRTLRHKGCEQNAIGHSQQEK